MKKHTLLKRATAAALLSATLATPAVIGLAGTASAAPMEHTVGSTVCSQSGGAWQSFWGAGGYIGGTCTYSGVARYHYDANDVMYMEERRVKGKWVRYNG